MVKYASNLPRESVVDVEGTLSIPASPVSGCTQTGVELKALTVRAISRAEPLPFDLVDAGRPDAAASEDGAGPAAPAGPTVAPDTRLDARVVDLRVPAMNAVFVLQAAVGRLFRSTMDGLGFQEIHSPCLIAGASEGGAACFRLDYCGRPACLAQSPQLYKQMALCADFERVYEVTPVFRAEKSFTHRHLTEFTGLDFEMCINEHYDEVRRERAWRERRWEREVERERVVTVARARVFTLIFYSLSLFFLSFSSPTKLGPGRHRRPVRRPLRRPERGLRQGAGRHRQAVPVQAFTLLEKDAAPELCGGHPAAGRFGAPRPGPHGRPEHGGGAAAGVPGGGLVRHRLLHSDPLPRRHPPVLHHARPGRPGLVQFLRRVHSG